MNRIGEVMSLGRKDDELRLYTNVLESAPELE